VAAVAVDEVVAVDVLDANNDAEDLGVFKDADLLSTVSVKEPCFRGASSSASALRFCRSRSISSLFFLKIRDVDVDGDDEGDKSRMLASFCLLYGVALCVSDEERSASVDDGSADGGTDDGADDDLQKEEEET
jgi:hypothetical protein